MLIAIAVGGGVLGLAKLFPVSFWGFVGFFVVVLTIGMVLWMNHKRTASVLQSSFRPTTTQSAFKNRSYIDVQVPFGLQGSAYRGVRSAHTVEQLGGRLSLCPQQPPRGSLLNNSTRASPVCSFTISYAQMKKEKKLRKGHQDGFVYAQSLTKFSGVNLMANRRMPPGTPDSLTPLPSRGISKLGSFNQPVPDFSNNTESLAQWVSTVKPGSVPQAPQQTTGLAPRNSYTQRRRMSSVGSVGMISEAGSRWDNHGRLDSVEASAWAGVHISDVESSAQGDEGDDESSLGGGSRLHGHSRSSGDLSRSDWNGMSDTLHTLEDFGRSVRDVGGTAASSTFFADLQVPDHGDDYDDDNPDERSPGGMTAAGSAWETPASRLAGGYEEASSRWDGSPAPRPAGAKWLHRYSVSGFVRKQVEPFR